MGSLLKKEASPEELADMCREAGVKPTSQRIEILRLLLYDSKHPDAQSIYKQAKIRFPTISLNTVYQTLHRFEEAGLVSRVAVVGDRMIFESDRSSHHHFICTECDNVFDFVSDSLDAVCPPPEAADLGRVTLARLEVRGVCRDCLAHMAVS